VLIERRRECPHERTGASFRAGGVIGWPTTFVLTKDWTIYKKYVGALPDKEARIKKDIDTLLSRSH